MAPKSIPHVILSLAIALAVVFAPAVDGYGGSGLPSLSEAMGARILAPASPEAVAQADRPHSESYSRRAALPEPAGRHMLAAFALIAFALAALPHGTRPKPQATVAAFGSRGPPIPAL